MVIGRPTDVPVLVDYRDAIEPWAKRAAREGRVINHVRFHYGQCEVTTIPKRQAQRAAATEEAPEPKSRGPLI